MISELKDIMIKLESLSDEDQKQIAIWLIEELKWEELFKKSQDQLSGLAEEAIQEYKAGKTTSFDDL